MQRDQRRSDTWSLEFRVSVLGMMFHTLMLEFGYRHVCRHSLYSARALFIYFLAMISFAQAKATVIPPLSHTATRPRIPSH